MEKIISKVLNKFLGDWIGNLNSEQLNISLFKGVVSLEDLTLKTDILHILGLPFDLTHGTVKKILVKIPWKNLLSSPLTIEISDVHAYLTPKSPSSWSENSELDALAKAKTSSIDKFEAFESEEIKTTESSSSFAKRSLVKIIENVQIVIKNLYIRYEDDITSQDKFAFGLMFQELKAETCDQSWEPKFVIDQPMLHKLITLKNFAIFFDFNTEMISLTEKYRQTIDQAFSALVEDEFSYHISHNYLIHPFDIETKLSLSKEKQEFKLPLLYTNVKFSSFNANFYSGQVKIVLKFLKFLKLYNTFQVGIKQLKIERPFNPEAELMYRDLYRKWMDFNRTDKKKKAAQGKIELMEKEEMVTFEDIIRVRSDEISAIKKGEFVELKTAEIEKLTKKLTKHQGRLKKSSGNTEKTRKKVQDLLELIEQCNKDLQAIRVKSSLTRSASTEFIVQDEDWEKFMGALTIGQGGLTLFGNEGKLIITHFTSIALSYSIRHSSLTLNFQLTLFTINDMYLKKSLFPKLFDLSSLSISFCSSPLRFEIDSEISYICCVFPTIFKIVEVFQEAFTAQSDISIYTDLINQSYNKYLDSGQSYLMNVIKKEGPPAELIDLEINMKAPVLIFPGEPTGQQGFLYVDLGRVRLKTEKTGNFKEKNGSFKEKFQFALSGLAIFAVWQWKSLENPQDWIKSDVVQPHSASLDFEIAKINHVITGLSINLHLNSTKLFINSLILNLLLTISNKIVNFIPKNVSKENLSPKLVEQKDIIQKISEFQEIIPVEFILNYDCIEIALNGITDLAFISVYYISVIATIKSNREIQGYFQVTSFGVQDRQAKAAFSSIICNPYMKFIGMLKKKANNHQLLVNFVVKPSESLTDICIILDDLRINLSQSFIFALLDLFKNFFLMLPQSKPNQEPKTPAYFIDVNSNIRINILMKNLEFWVPADSLDASSQIVHFYLAFTAVYMSTWASRSFYTGNNNIVSVEYFTRTDEIDLTLSHFGADLKKSRNDLTRGKYLIMPSRLSLETKIIKKINEEATNVYSTLRIESFCLAFGFRDIQFLKTLMENLPKMQGGMKKKNEKKEKPDLLNIYVGVDVDALQITMVDDTLEGLQSLFYLKFSNISFSLIKTLEKILLKGEIIMLINNYNKHLGAWEPLLGDCKFILEAIQESDQMTVQIETKSTLEFNFTYSLAVCLGTFTKRISENPDIWAKEQISESNLADQSIFEYVVINKLETSMIVWLQIGKSPEEWPIGPSDSISFPQSLVNKLNSRSNQKSKSTLILNNIQIPTQLAFKFGKHNQNVYHVLIDEIAMQAILVSSDKSQFPCFVNVLSREGKRLIVFDSNLFFSNAGNSEISISFDDLELTVKPNETISLPSSFALRYKDQMKIGNTNVNLKDSIEININNCLAVVEINEYKIEELQNLILIEFSPEFYLQNLLNCEIALCDENQNYLFSNTNEKIALGPGEDTVVNIEPKKLYTFQVTDLKTRKTFFTEKISLFNLTETEIGIEKVSGSFLMISASKKEKKTYKTDLKGIFSHYDLDLTTCQKSFKNSSISSWLISIYSDFIIVNKTQQVLLLENLEVPIDEIRYFSSKSKKLRVKLKNFRTKWSEKFRVDTIGMAGMVKIMQKERSFPKYFLFGLAVSQAPNPLVNSNIVTFFPRFMMWNYLDFPIFIRQYAVDQNIPFCLDSCEGNDASSLVYHLDDYEGPKALIVSCNGEQWSGPFGIENIEDFQLGLTDKSNNHEKNLFSIGNDWFLPSIDHQRYIRIVITSNDDATIHIAFMNPKIPDFRIVNKTEFLLHLKQKSSGADYIELDSHKSINWVWSDFLIKKKKIKVKVGDDEQSYSIEKIQKYESKKLRDFEVSVRINNLTRELVIEQPQNNEQRLSKINRKSNFDREGYNPRHGSAIFNIAEIIQFSQDYEPHKSKFKVVVKLPGIGLSVFDTDGKENLYVSLGKVKVIQSINQTEEFQGFSFRKNKILKTNIKVEHFQIDSMDPDPNLFAVILSPAVYQKTTEKASENQKTTEKASENLKSTEKAKENQGQIIEKVPKEKYYFLMFDLQIRSSTKGSKKNETTNLQVENLEFRLQKIEIKLNQEVIMKLINLKDYSKAFKSGPIPGKSLEKFLDLNNDLPTLDPKIFSLSKKIYYHLVSLGVLHFFITFRKCSIQSNYNQDIKFRLVIDLIKNLGGAFANLTRAPLQFKELIILNSFQTPSDLARILGINYLRQGIIQFYKVFGSIDLIGNPLELVNNLGTGVFEFFSEPAKGLIGGPKAFVKGLGKGVKSLVAGMIGGSFDSISKISGTLYSAVKNATGDEVLKHNPENGGIGKNILIGLKETALDAYQGIAGVISKPIRGGKDKGVKGFFQGVLSGAAGLITSPIKIVLKVGNVISSSIASTAFLLAKGKIQTFGRVRFPRHISANKVIEPYNCEFSQAQAFLLSIKKYSNQRLIYFSEINLDESDSIRYQSNIILLITPLYFIYVLNGDLYKHIPISQIKYLELHQVKKYFFLCLTTKQKNFSIPSDKYSSIVCIYNALYSFNSEIVCKFEHKFKRPKMFHADNNNLAL